ncbi:TetR/AcrR family transcriptional regulator [Sandaracinobacter neustonicus]|nr:TetR/AcrR family transcriptional regulator [Sandaracinobacter neustonicus]
MMPNQTRAQAARRKILNATYALLGERAPAEIDMAAIAGRAGMTAVEIHRHFAGSMEIFRALAEQAMETVDGPLEDMLLSGASLQWLTEHAVGLLIANNTVADRRLLELVRSSQDLVDIWTLSRARVVGALTVAVQARNPRLPEPVRQAAVLVLAQAMISGADAILSCEDGEQRLFMQRELVAMGVAYLEKLMVRT